MMAKVVVDTTGDGDMFSRAGAEFDTDIEEGDVHQSMNTGFMLGGVDMKRWINWKVHTRSSSASSWRMGREELGFFQPPYVSWRPDIALFLGPRQSGLSALDVDDQTELEIRSHRFMEAHCGFFREHAPGFENAYIAAEREPARRAPYPPPRRRRADRAQLVERRRPRRRGRRQPLDQPEVPCCLGALWRLVPRRLDGLLAGGRHIAATPIPTDSCARSRSAG